MENMSVGDKHAFLIMAHNNFYNLEILIKLLDDERNDIFLHIDKKVHDFKKEYFLNLVKKADLFISQEVRVNWGGYSQVRCEMFLLEQARNRGDYRFYHLLSSSDLPIKTQDEIHDFFDAHPDQQFIQFDKERLEQNKKKIYRRLQYYHPIQEIRKCSNNKIIEGLITLAAKSIMAVQMIFRVNRMKNRSITIFYGSQWFSINQDFVDFILNNRKKIKEMFCFSQTPDELFIQILAMNSRFKDSIYWDGEDYKRSNLREIGWNYEKDDEHPQVYTAKDFEKLESSSAFFARKFSDVVDRQIIDMIYSRYGGEAHE